MDRVIKRILTWVFLTIVWGFVPGSLVFGVLMMNFHAWVTCVVWGLVAGLVLGGGVAAMGVRRMARPGSNQRVVARAVATAFVLDALFVAFDLALVALTVPYPV